MKGAFFVTSERAFLQRARLEMESWPHEVFAADDVGIRLVVAGTGTLLIEPARFEFEWRDVLPVGWRARSDLWGFSVSCRSEELFCCVAQALKSRLGIDLWVVDDGDEILDAAQVRPDTIRL